MKFTIFIPTYNSGYCLERVYSSLRAKTYIDFEWVIIGDGSVDNTCEFVESRFYKGLGRVINTVYFKFTLLVNPLSYKNLVCYIRYVVVLRCK